MKKNSLIVGFSVVFFFALALKFLYNNSIPRWHYFSESPEYSKSIGAFVAKMEILNIHTNPNYPLDKLDFLLGSNIWLEKLWHREPYFVFFHPIQFTQFNSLVLDADKLGTVQKGEPILFARIAGRGSSGEIRENGVVGFPKINLPDSLSIVFYYGRDDEVGTVTLARTDEDIQ